MNILIDRLPNEYEGLKINTNFRSFILFELIMQDGNLDEREKITAVLPLFYENIDYKDIKKALQGIIWFYKLGKEDKPKNNDNSEEKKKKNIYSYEHDANYIYSAFLSQYNVDLQDIEYLHWWKFKALFDGLNDDNKIVEIMGYRAIDLSKIKDKDEKARYRKLKRQYALPDERTEKEKEQDFADAFW